MVMAPDLDRPDDSRFIFLFLRIRVINQLRAFLGWDGLAGRTHPPRKPAIPRNTRISNMNVPDYTAGEYTGGTSKVRDIAECICKTWLIVPDIYSLERITSAQPGTSNAPVAPGLTW